jgi:hypothetical protein
MPYLILSDVMATGRRSRRCSTTRGDATNRSLCQGDLAGYGADPNFAVNQARAHVAAGQPTIER